MAEKKKYFFVSRPIVAIVIAIVIVIVGIVSLIGLPIEQYPDLTPPVVQVRATYTGANAIDVEESVATPLEQQINGVDNMIYMKSTNANDGSMVIDISFEVGTNVDMNTVLSQNRVSAATARLPSDVTKYGVTTKKSLPNILMLVTLTSDGRYDQNFLGNYALINIRDELARIGGVGRVDVLGASDYSMRIWVEPDKLAQMGLTVSDIQNAINQQNVIAPGGQFGAEPAPPGTEFTYTVRLPERFNTAEAFGEIVVRILDDGSEVKLRDIATIDLGVETYNSFTRMNEKTASIIGIYQSPGSNAVDLRKQVVAEMERLAPKFPEGVVYEVSLDATLPITAGIKDIVVTLIIAIFLVVLVVFLFIQDWRATLIPTIAIPVSLIGTFMLFPLLGFTINVLSLLGLVLAIGIVVDDAIVVVEAVQVNIERGMSSKQATIDAMSKVAAPVVATTLVLMAVFIPVAGMAGITGRLYQQFAITIAVSVFISSINALTLSPALSSLILKKPTPIKGPLGAFFKIFNKYMGKTTTGYLKLTKVLTRRAKRGIIFLLILTAAAGLLSKVVPSGFIPEEDMGYFFINVQLPNAASLQRSDDISKQIETILMNNNYIKYATTATGYSMLSGSFSSNNSFIFITLIPWGDRSETAKEIVNDLNKEFSAKILGAQVFAFGPPALPGLGNGAGFSIMLQDKGGNTPEYLAKHAQNFIEEVNKRPEIGNAYTTFQATVPQRYMDIDKQKALKLGVSLEDLYNTIGAFMGGSYVNDFTRFGRLYKTYVQAEPQYRVSEKDIGNYFVRNRHGEMVPLATMITIKDVSGPSFTNRFNMYRSVEVTGVPSPAYTSQDALNTLEEVANEVLPIDMGYSWNAMSYQQEKAAGSLPIILTFALLFVFLILSAQYESWSLPISILLGTPFAIFGAFLGLYLARLVSPTFENNIFAQVSFVMLLGMAAKNAILIVEYANDEFKSGKSLFDSALNAAKERFRPILMTAFSFIFGIFPLVIATGSGAESRKVMGMALLGGMIVATFLGVFFYPMLFNLIAKISGYEKKRDIMIEESKANNNDESSN